MKTTKSPSNEIKSDKYTSDLIKKLQEESLAKCADVALNKK